MKIKGSRITLNKSRYIKTLLNKFHISDRKLQIPIIELMHLVKI